MADLVALAREALSDRLSEDRRIASDAGLIEFERVVARRTLRRRTPALPWFIVVGAAAAALVVSMLTLRDRPHTVTFSVVNGTVSNGGYVRANPSGDTALHFSDGSSVALDPGTGARVGDFDAHGARVLLESGRARIHVNPRPRANWTVDAGPYSVHVIGTQFDIRWSANEEVLDLHLLKGSIVVRGPLARDGISMEAGAHLFANVRKGEIRLDGPKPAGTGDGVTGTAAAAAREAPPASISSSTASSGSNAVTASTGYDGAHPTRAQPPTSVQRLRAGARAGTPPDSSWSARLTHGDFQGVLADAQHRGLDSVFTRAPVGDLNALADAARFARRVDVARGALLAERSRFPGSPQGREAAFFLGGLSEDESGAAALKAALDWYDCYLRESPTGAFVRPVLGRKMVLIQKLRGSAAARPIAAEYLQRFSDGPYAGTARKLTAGR
ncbi:MAG TPA: FecR domain-containing protein [Polyangia bacterium]|nr:FecR domain-containing protein [Polyangia bacterium]